MKMNEIKFKKHKQKWKNINKIKLLIKNKDRRRT